MNSADIITYLKSEACPKYKTNIVRMGIPAEYCISVSRIDLPINIAVLTILTIVNLYGKCGLLRETYLKEHKEGAYNRLLISGKLQEFKLNRYAINRAF